MSYRKRPRPIRTLRLLGFAGLCAICALVAGSRTPTELERIIEAGTLPIISRNGPTTYYEGPVGLTGFEYSLASAFAKELGVKLEIHEEENLGVMLDSVGTSAGQFSASGLTVTETRKQKVRFATPYLDVTQQLIYRRGSSRPADISDLIGKDILVIANSAHAENLRKLQEQHPELRWRERADLEMIDLVEMVHDGKIDYTIIDSNAYDINRTIYPRARIAFDISEPQQLAWAFPKSRDTSLFDAAEKFLKRANSDGTLNDIKDYYYGHVDEVNHSGALVFSKRIKNRLPRYRGYLQVAGDMFNLEWELLAAISYQESHWNPRAKSPTGVRGLMMLTRTTASEVGVENRVDPIQSIYGGAKYFKKIFQRIPQGVQGADRTWMALAAYNVGFGHLEDARVLTQKHGGDPNKWADVKETLPLLAKRKYYRKTKHGYARGWEPVKYVQNIRNFYNVLAWHSQIETRRIAATEPKAALQAVNFDSDRLSGMSQL